ncbi:hypothetical protein MSG28_015797 [Choristoneura fumiferana]|uniref:Uncharacterized protein n=1 Tax=Choristoneura fumiferana TaxID=7141 RepID=A0ACC0KBK6_CHOFU|nr:hypothetical protein MSG28_015797 [Choristoneura fumiferana]
MTSLMKTIVFNQRRITANVLRSFSTASEIPKYDTLAVSEPKKHVFHVELNRPKKLNAFNHAMWLEMKHCFESLSENRACRVVVLSAQGKHFTAGIDLNSFMEKASDASEFEEIARKVRFMNKLIRTYQDGITALEKCVKPVITVSHSACVGAGVDLVTAADMSKYLDLAHEVTAMWDVDSTVIVPIVVSANGLIAKSLDQHLKRLSLDGWIKGQIQKAVLLDTARIVRRFLTLRP